MSQTPDKQHSSEDHDEKPIRQHKELCGALFVNRKKKNNGQPDRTGTCTINVTANSQTIDGFVAPCAVFFKRLHDDPVQVAPQFGN